MPFEAATELKCNKTYMIQGAATSHIEPAVIYTTRMSRVPPLAGDDEIVAKIAIPVEAQTPFAEARCVALLNDAGQPYRLVMTRGEVEFLALCERLDWLAFSPSEAAYGIDVVFGRREHDDFAFSV